MNAENYLASEAELDPASFRAACALFPTGVTVVTRMSNEGRPYGMTVSSFTSVSLRPPLVLVCADKRAGFVRHLAPGMPFAVNVLREDQQLVAVRFSTAPEHIRFENLDWTEGLGGTPLLADTVATFECTLSESVEAGDHLIIVGRVQKVNRKTGYPLVWCGSSYHCIPGLR